MTRLRLTSSWTLTAQVEVVQMADEPADVDGDDGVVPADEAPQTAAVCWEASTGWARAGWWFGEDVCAPTRWLR